MQMQIGQTVEIVYMDKVARLLSVKLKLKA